MNEPKEDDLERLLRVHFDGPLADDGFSARVMRVLPPRPRRRRWPVPAALLAGAALSATSVEAVLAGAAGGRWIGAALACVVSVLAAAWALSEAPA